MEKDSKIFVAGGTGLAGSATINQLIKKGFTNIVANYHSKKPFIKDGVRFVKLNLLDQDDTVEFFEAEKPEYLFLAAAKVGGIVANNTYRADFIYQNLQIQNNLLHQSYLHGVKKVLFLGSSCIYPKMCQQPIKEEYLLTGELEDTNEPYAIAKIAGIKMCESYNTQYGTNFIAAMPTNLYGDHDNFDLEKSHVLPALIRKMHLSKLLMTNDFEAIKKDFSIHDKNIDTQSNDEIKSFLNSYGIYGDRLVLWGSGNPMREFLHVKDLADAIVYLMQNYNPKENFKNSHVNVGTGKDIKIFDVAYIVKEIVGFDGVLEWDRDKPDGTPKKVLDTTKLNSLGWEPNISLKNGIESVYANYLTKGKSND
ncbi:MAG: GDP-L-fucose synthase [Campylobacterales bacterium]|nr:GDP-L-fucose synthase [Campylobacterales bacterium]